MDAAFLLQLPYPDTVHQDSSTPQAPSGSGRRRICGCREAADRRGTDMGKSQQDARQALKVEPSLGRILSHVERQTSRLIEAAVASQGLTVDQWRVLDVLADSEGHSMSELAGAIVVPGPTLTKIVDK